MKKFVTYLLAFFLLLAAPLCAQESLQTAETALAQGDSKSLATVLNSNIDITFNNKVKMYSKAQAEVIIKVFLSKNRPQSFKVKYKGKSKTNNTIFTIGQMETASGSYRVYMFFIPNKKAYVLRELRFEKLD